MDTDFSDISHEKKRAFLLAYADIGMINRAAKKAGISRRTHYNWLHSDDKDGEAYRAAFNGLQIQVHGSIEDEIYRRAIHGTRKPVFCKGSVCGHIREYSDTLLIFLAKAMMPKKYRDNTIDTAPTQTAASGALVDALEQLWKKEGYVEFLRARAIGSSSQPGDMGGNGESGPVADGKPPSSRRPGSNGNGRAGG